MNSSSFFHIVLVIIGCTFILVITASFIDAKFIRRNDFYKIGALILASIHCLDTLSAIFFVIQITIHPEFKQSTQLITIFIITIICIIISICITLFQLYHTTNKHWINNDELRSWLSEYTYLLYMLSIICGGSFNSIQLCRSNLFNLSVFDIPLNKKQLLHFQTKKIYSTVLIQHIPLTILTACYISISASSININIIAYIAMTFSIISILITIASTITARKLVYSQAYSSIEFTITSAGIAANAKQCRNRVNQIRDQICGILGLRENLKLLEIMRPIQIPNGVRLHLNIYINNYNAEGMDSNYEKLITDAKNSGQLSNFIQYSWGLTDIPVIGNIEYKHHESKDKIRNSMNIQIEDHAIQGNGIKEDEIMVIIDPDNENVYTVKFEHKPFGMEWTETENKRNLYVSEITVDGQADIAGVTMGSIVIGLNDIDVQNVGARGIHEKAVSFGLPLKVTFMRSNMNDKVENDDEKK
eukprot:161793_1